jgi:anti-anti-sigma factor
VPLAIERTVVQGIVVLKVVGTLTLGPSLSALREAANREVKQNNRYIALDMSNIVSVDSAGLGELTIAFGLLYKIKGKIVMFGSSQALLKMLEMTRLEELIPVVNNQEEAIKVLLSNQ